MKAQTVAGDDSARKLRANADLAAYINELARGEAQKRATLGNLLLEDPGQVGTGAAHGGKLHVKELSFSGFERNPIFYNTGGKFADIGGALGAALLDDGRAVVAADFDGDGDDDLVVHNVFRPHVVAFRNDVASEPQLVVRLRGVKSNRFGVGARVVVSAGGLKRVDEITCGSGYLSARPPEAHFGLGGKRATVEVHWPTGEVQRAEDIGSGILTFEEGAKAPLFAAHRAAPDAPEVACVRMIRSGDLFTMNARSAGKAFEAASLGGKPTVVHLWSSNCFSCKEEILHYREVVEAVKAAGLEFLSVNLSESPDRVAKNMPPGGWPVPVWILQGPADSLLPAIEPTLPLHLVVGADGRILDRLIGSLSPKELADEAKKICGRR